MLLLQQYSVYNNKYILKYPFHNFLPIQIFAHLSSEYRQPITRSHTFRAGECSGQPHKEPAKGEKETTKNWKLYYNR